ncbi:hypothetical protein PAXINDRAFT_123590 [Paxillus involutus ATCC 200175]|nr:hypothetical protein PAXINDRAFT_123590 [Paxillus involutus ATCC 200175]
MPASEIDDIFASKGKANIVSKSPPIRPSFPEKKKKKKKKASSTPVEESTSLSSKKRSAPETVVDPSVQSVFKKRLKSAASSNPTQPSSKDQFKEGEERFKDSRGFGSRRKTQEGYNIYNEDELGMSARGGGEFPRLFSFFILRSLTPIDTPLCPFDCECCF